ncbi:DUF2956 domain-containing protein [Paraferrimonas haliotis]|uniref:Membrane protein n=1 Tax=Paraferrimonas haliotis TaxID=2013866 RepID=A0AA37TJK9_9GAMM|nr:DUF2956 domain-containing protein [Paraferrimonas haliotis]GLS82439.1 membrane protein [Paraferrimonas haliotis]
MKNKVSTETQQQALQVAKATQKPGQTKEQTKLIAQGIEKGIAEYKKRQKAQARQRDKQRKQAIKQKQPSQPLAESPTQPVVNKTARLPWALLALSWLGFILFTLAS